MRLLLDLVLPPHCPGCGREGDVLCDRCRRPLRRRDSEPPGVPLGLPAAMPPDLVQLEWCATFSGPVRAALHALKYDGERRLAIPLGDSLAERWQRAGAGGDLVSWVPVHPSRRRERGFDQAELLAIRMAERLGLAGHGLLERQLRTTAQHRLGQLERAGNLHAAFVLPERARPTVTGRWVVLVDDIVTTGATLGASARSLLDAGAVAVSAITVARDR